MRHNPPLRQRLHAALMFASVLPLLAAQPAHAAPAAYQPRPVEIPKDASYVLPDGSIYIVGVEGMEDILKQFNALFTKTHPGIRFTMLLTGSASGIGGLTAGVSALAPMGREAWPTDIAGFREMYGHEPFDVRIGHDGFGPRPKSKNPPAIYVNAKNPLASLTVDEVARIFTSGGSDGDITRWNQVGLKGAWAAQEIHPYGPRDDGGLATSARMMYMGKRQFTRNYESREKNVDVAKAVAQDPQGIAFIGFLDATTVPGIRLLPLSYRAGEPAAGPSYENVAAGKYPYSPFMHMYVNRAPGKPMDPLVKEYLRLVLSKEGQAIIAAQKDTDEGYVPLSEVELAEELAKLD